jgi:hypothetical protein
MRKQKNIFLDDICLCLTSSYFYDLQNSADFEMKTIRKKELGEDELMDEREIKEKMVANQRE